jgi:hypothetical protein
VVWEALTTKEVVRAPEAMLTVAGLKDVVAVIPSLLVAVKVMVPVKPPEGVTVKVTPLEVAPDVTVTDVAVPVHGVKPKSLPETMSTEAIEPLG